MCKESEDICKICAGKEGNIVTWIFRRRFRDLFPLPYVKRVSGSNSAYNAKFRLTGARNPEGLTSSRHIKVAGVSQFCASVGQKASVVRGCDSLLTDASLKDVDPSPSNGQQAVHVTWLVRYVSMPCCGSKCNNFTSNAKDSNREVAASVLRRPTATSYD
jgi:hypothetical protein